MMNIDEKIKKVLDEEAQEIDQLMLEESGIFGMLKSTFKGGMRFWLVLVYIFGVAASIGMLWTGYNFWVAEVTDDAIFWGVAFLFLTQMQIALKMWGFMEMNRTSMIREIKRVEILLARQADDIQNQ